MAFEQVDGGAGYYGQFANGLPVDPGFFPIAVWGSYDHTLANRNLDAAAGINTYQWVADPSFMDEIQADGRFWMIQVHESLSAANRTSKVTGRYTHDELDMECGDNQCADDFGRLESTISNQTCVTRCADGLALYANYGKGVMFWNSDANAARWINGTSSFGRYQDIVHDDVYWFTDPYVCGGLAEGPRFYGTGSALPANWCRNGANYGDTVTELRRLDALDGKRVPIWNVIEASWPFENQSGARAIQPAELRSAVWHSLIAGARGILWFQHSFGGPCAGDHHVIRTNCEGTRPAVTAVNKQITDLAPVLNAPTATTGHTITDTMDGRARAMVKWHDGHFYIFIGADRSGGQATFTMPCLGTATAINLGETTGNLVIPLANGQFTDQFPDRNAIHIYRIDGQSRCGL